MIVNTAKVLTLEGMSVLRHGQREVLTVDKEGALATVQVIYDITVPLVRPI